MTSLLRSIATLRETPVKTIGITGPFYKDSSLSDIYMPFPFIVENGVLDINLTNSFEADMITITGKSPQSNDTDSTNKCRLIGGLELVTSLGPNFIRYINAWRTSIDNGQPITIVVNPTMTKIQIHPQSFLETDNGYKESTVPPSGDSYSWGDDSNNWQTVWIFRSPLTFSIVESGVTKYITLSTELYADYS